MSRREFRIFLALLFGIVTNNVSAQKIEVEEDFPIGKITIKFSEGTLIRKVAERSQTGERTSIKSKVEEGSSAGDEALLPQEEQPKFAFISDFVESPERFQLAPDASISLDKLRGNLMSFNKMISDLNVNPIRTFAAQSAEELTKLRENAERNLKKDIDDLNLYYDIYYNEKTLYRDVKEFIENSSALEIVEVAEPASPPVETPSPDFESDQTYLPKPMIGSTSADGVGALAAWNISGGTGIGVKIMDIEHAWNPSHEDFPNLFFNSGNYFTGFGNDHGTAVVGILGAKRNSMGVTGITYDSQIGLMSSHVTGSDNIAQSILSSISQLGTGDIILIEAQTQLPSSAQNDTCNSSPMPFGPVEWNSAIFSAIQTATGNGIIVVQAGGNGGLNLDHPSMLNRFDRSTRDSGAIIVAAALGPPHNHKPTCYSPYGSRIDSHARAQLVTTLGYGYLHDGGANALYTDSFGGTSSASPIVAASAASIQGMLKAAGRPPLSATAMRQLLTTTGSPQVADFGRNIATLPNIIEAAKSLDLIEPLKMIPIYYLLLLEEGL